MSVRGAEPLVSVVLPTFNRADLLGRAIDSVRQQTYRTFELLVVDDGSTDDTAALIAGIADDRLRYLPQSANRGQAAARNEGLRRARGDFISFQDSDDVWMPDRLARLMAAFETAGPRVGVVYSDMLRVWRDGRVTYHRSPTVVRGRMLDDKARFYQMYGLGIQATVMRRSCLEWARGFNERLRCFEDLELFIRLLRRYDFLHVEAPLTQYHESSGVSAAIDNECRARRWLLWRYGFALAMESPWFVRREFQHVRACKR